MTDRKARLAALAARAGRTKPAATEEEGKDHPAKDGDKMKVDDEHDDEKNNKNEEKKPTILFRNYVPTDPTLTSASASASIQEEESNDTTNIDDEPSQKRQRTTSATTTSQQQQQPKSALQEALAKAQQDVAPLIGSTISSAGEGLSSTAAAATTNSIMKPKKINWDLKRDIQTKIDKLEKRTQRAIVQLLKTRLEKEAEEEAAAYDDEDDYDDENDLD